MGNEILLMDGVIYEEWTNPSHDELAQMVREHHREIFGEGSLDLGIGTRLGGGSIAAIPDGYCLTFERDTLWVIEVELSTADRRHLVGQLNDFINGLEDPVGQRRLRDALLPRLEQQPQETRQPLTTRVPNLALWLEYLISHPSLLVITERATDETRRAVAGLRMTPTVKEFRTFRRRGAEAVHIHQFEPLVAPTPTQELTAIFPEPSRPVQRGGVGLAEVLEVSTLVLNGGRAYNEAVRTVAQQRQVRYQTVVDKCTRKLGLNTDQFRTLLTDRDRLVSFLAERFPDDRDHIQATLRPAPR